VLDVGEVLSLVSGAAAAGVQSQGMARGMEADSILQPEGQGSFGMGTPGVIESVP
jgi:hypothetical protein